MARVPKDAQRSVDYQKIRFYANFVLLGQVSAPNVIFYWFLAKNRRFPLRMQVFWRNLFVGDRKGCRGATKMARMPKDAQRSLFLEGKNKNENLAPLVCLRPANVCLFFQKSQNRGFRPNSIKRDCTLRARKRPQGGPKSIFFFFEKTRLFPSKIRADRLSSPKTQFFSPG